MNVHPEEIALARAYNDAAPFEGLTDNQMQKIMARGRELFHWFKAHRRIHFAISTITLVTIFALDFWLLVKLPAWLMPGGASESTTRIVIAAFLCGGLHSWLMYSLSVYSMHEGAAHKIIFPPEGPITKVLHRIAAIFAGSPRPSPITTRRDT